MKKGVICVLVCMLMMLSAVVPVLGIIFTKEPSQQLTTRNAQYDDAEKIFNDLKVKLDEVTTRQEALVFINEAIVELNEYGLLPKGMTVKQAQRLVAQMFLKVELLQPSQRGNENNTGNYNCLMVGITNATFFRPFPTIFDIPFIYNLYFNSNRSDLLNFLIIFYILRTSQPFKLGPFAYIGSEYRHTQNGNITSDHINPASGWVWTFGGNSIKKWNGSFYGGLYYRKLISNDSNDVWEGWDAVGIKGFIGIQPFCFLSSTSYELPCFYIGFARKVNFTYGLPWAEENQ